MREGLALRKAVAPYMQEDRGRTWRLFAVTVSSCLLAGAGVVWSPPWLALPLSLLLGLLYVRLFIFYHDALHGALFRGSRLGMAFMHAVGWWLLAVVSVWRETHDYHHQHNAKLVGSAIGSYPVVTLGMWRGMSPRQRLAYRALRHPLTILAGYFTLFVVGMGLAPFRRQPARHWQGVAALLAHLLWVAAAVALLGWWRGLLLSVVPLMVAQALGSYLFFAQHNFPSMELRERRQWDYEFAALRSSSMFDMPGWMHWFTGNIGYHHVHHLNHRIPFYRLPEAMREVVELQRPGRTSWRVQDVRACLSLAVWDPARGRMLTYSELADAGAQGQPQLAHS